MKIPNNCSCDTQMYLQGQICGDCMMNENMMQAILKAFDAQVFVNNDEKLWFAVNACLRLIKFKFEQDEMFGHISLEEHETIEEALGRLWAKNFWSSIFSSKTRTNEVAE